jgi:hypothetical protein
MFTNYKIGFYIFIYLIELLFFLFMGFFAYIVHVPWYTHHNHSGFCSLGGHAFQYPLLVIVLKMVTMHLGITVLSHSVTKPLQKICRSLLSDFMGSSVGLMIFLNSKTNGEIIRIEYMIKNLKILIK